MIIYANGELEPLQMVSELDTEPCVSEEAEPRRGVDMDTKRCASKYVGPRRRVDWGGGGEVSYRLEKGTSTSEDAGPRRGWMLRSHISWRRE